MHNLTMCLATAMAVLGAQQAQAACTIAAPSSPSTAAFGTLQLPIDADGNGSPDTVSGSRLQTYSSQYFERQGSDRIVMRVPTGSSATTPNSKYPRSELKEGRTWNVNEGCAGLAARVNIYDLPDRATSSSGRSIRRRQPRDRRWNCITRTARSMQTS